jgi:hypothetical protein
VGYGGAEIIKPLISSLKLLIRLRQPRANLSHLLLETSNTKHVANGVTHCVYPARFPDNVALLSLGDASNDRGVTTGGDKKDIGFAIS